MEAELLQNIIVNLPNFIFAALCIAALMKRLSNQDRLIDRLIDKWEKCEDNNDTQALLATQKAGE